MLRSIVNRRLQSAEHQLGLSMDYMRFIMKASPGAFRRFASILPLNAYHRAVPAAPYYVARIVASRDEHCGACMHAEGVAAKDDGVAADVIDAAQRGVPELLPAEANDAYQFAEAVVRGQDEAVWRERVRQRWGDEGVVELALAIATARLFPMTRRALGYASPAAQPAEV